MRRRRGRPGLLGTMARTAVISGTATAVSGRVHRHGEARAQAQAGSDRQAAEAEPASPPAAAPPPAGGVDLTAQLQRLADMKAAGALDDAEFTAAKARLLGS